MDIYVEPIEEEQLKPLFTDPKQLGFGSIFTDRMFTMKYSKDKGWHDAKIEKYKPFSLDPAACVLHYSQEIFEGLKAYLSEDGKVLMFRPEQNARRMNRSAKRLCMPEIPEEYFLQGMKELVLMERRWIPDAPGTSLYIRPTLLGVEPFLGVNPSAEYLFYIILSPVGPYFKAGFNPVSIYVEDKLVRAVVGGVGDVKTGGNYAASLMAGLKAQEKGFSQVLWLDAKEQRYIEEVGAMNIFFVYQDKLVTPPLTGSILPGITRASIIEMARDLGYQVEESPITIDEAIEGITEGRIKEVFGSGTAAVISPVGSLYYKDKNYVVNNNEVGQITRTLYNGLVDIQYGRAEDKYGWVHVLGRK
ncbi:branched-chain amino acid aminotransferase [Desulfofalx alkaliphila]|uniref:branched-chain amino acid aminotransferase n=1 Tax=Desulfofalx alkaliphila TaxID=105483 RepID=UPI0004E22DC1|nr:branched-chain amino acid aminotransferase [Desulfofalx alkaliphila]